MAGRRLGDEQETGGVPGPGAAEPEGSPANTAAGAESPMLIVIGIVIAFALVLAYVRTVQWMQESQRTRFVFEERDTYLFLKLDRPLGAGESSLVTMRALREALLLKVAGTDSKRVLIQASALQIANRRAFWLLVGALGPMLLNERVKLAVVCRRRTRAAKLFHESGILIPFPSVREGERYLQSAQPRQRVLLDVEYVNSLLVPGRRKAA